MTSLSQLTSQSNSQSQSTTSSSSPRGKQLKCYTLGQLWVAYRLYKQKQNDHFLLPSGQGYKSWQTALASIQQQILDPETNSQQYNKLYRLNTSYECRIMTSKLRDYLSEYYACPQVGKRKFDAIRKQTFKHELMIYYCLHFDTEFLTEIQRLFDCDLLADAFLDLHKARDARVGHMIFGFPGSTCIQPDCGKVLTIVYRNRAAHHRGSISLVHHKHQRPLLATSYAKKCVHCNMVYSYNRIDFLDNKQSAIGSSPTAIRTIFLDPRDQPYFTLACKNGVFMHQTLFDSSSNAQFGSKSQSLDTWLTLFNEEWQKEYQTLAEKLKTPDTQTIGLNYKTFSRAFYFRHLLIKISDLKQQADCIVIDNKTYRKALIITKEDEQQMIALAKETGNLRCVDDRLKDVDGAEASDEKSYSDDSENVVYGHQELQHQEDVDGIEASDEKSNSADSAPTRSNNQYLHSHYYFKYFFNKYHADLERRAITSLKLVPVRLSKSKETIEIYKGWFVMYGDGGQKITRARCAFPAILAKEQAILSHKPNARNAIGSDANVDLALHGNSLLYSEARYFQCDASVCQISVPCTTNSKRRKPMTMKMCTKHCKLLVDHYGIELNEINLFAKWYCGHNTVARLKKLDIEESIKKFYANMFVDCQLKSMQHKNTQKIDAVEKEMASLMQNKKESEIKFQRVLQSALQRIQRHNQADDDSENEDDDISMSSNTNSNRKSADQPPPHKRPRRLSYRKALANLNEHKLYDQHNDFNELFEDILGETELETEYFATPQAIQEEWNSGLVNTTDYVANVMKQRGCRKPVNMGYANAFRTNGLNVLMNCAGMIIKFREEVIRETPTGVLLDQADALTNNDVMLDYANRVEALGYDMICCIFHRLQTLIKENRLSGMQLAFWYHMLPRLFIDIWHVASHTDKLCNEDSDQAIFHPTLGKFKEILVHVMEESAKVTRVNDIVAEQFWAKMNTAVQIKAMAKETFLFFLMLKTDYHNQRRVDAILAAGWTFVPIGWFTALRDLRRDSSQVLEFPDTSDLVANRLHSMQTVTVRAEYVDRIKTIINTDNMPLNDEQYLN